MSRRIFIVLFFFLTLLPGLQMVTNAFNISDVDENRELAPWVSTATPIDQTGAVADRWFSDHFGLRSLLIRLKYQIDFSLFDTSDRVLIGRSGQLFYKGTVNISEPLIEEFLGKTATQEVANFATLTSALRDVGIRVALVVNMMSDRFYGDLLPAEVTRRPEFTHIDDFVSRLRVVPGVTFVDSTYILKTLLKERRIFHRTDFHWNDPAAFEVAKALVDRMSVEEAMAKSPWMHTLSIVTERISGGIARFMPLFVPPSEDALMVRPTWRWPAGFVQGFDQGLFEYVTKADPSASLLPPTVFVGDSFLDGMMRSGLASNFEQTWRVRWKADLKFSDIIASLPKGSRWLVIQFIETEQPAFQALANGNDVAACLKILASRRPSRAGP